LSRPCRGSLGASMDAPRSGQQARLDALRLIPAGWRTRPLDRRWERELPCRKANVTHCRINDLTLSTKSAQYQGSERTRPPESKNGARSASAVSRSARKGAGNLRLSAPVTGREKGWIRGDWR
jgi:hypothetical protein